MEPLKETIDLDVEESNELLFRIKVEGVEQAPAKVRLVCEDGDLAYMFNGHPTGDEGVVQFLLPSLKGKLKEGVYQSRVEVLIENRYFAPVLFQINFKRAVTVVAEAVQVPRRAQPQVTITASPIVVAKKAPSVPAAAARPLVIEEQKPASSKVVPTKPSTTLRDRYANRIDEVREKVIDDVDEAGKALIKELARGFIKRK